MSFRDQIFAADDRGPDGLTVAEFVELEQHPELVEKLSPARRVEFEAGQERAREIASMATKGVDSFAKAHRQQLERLRVAIAATQVPALKLPSMKPLNMPSMKPLKLPQIDGLKLREFPRLDPITLPRIDLPDLPVIEHPEFEMRDHLADLVELQIAANDRYERDRAQDLLDREEELLDRARGRRIEIATAGLAAGALLVTIVSVAVTVVLA